MADYDLDDLFSSKASLRMKKTTERKRKAGEARGPSTKTARAPSGGALSAAGGIQLSSPRGVSLISAPFTVEAEQVLSEDQRKIFRPDWTVTPYDSVLGDSVKCGEVMRAIRLPRDVESIESSAIDFSWAELRKGVMLAVNHIPRLEAHYEKEEKEFHGQMKRAEKAQKKAEAEAHQYKAKFKLAENEVARVTRLKEEAEEKLKAEATARAEAEANVELHKDATRRNLQKIAKAAFKRALSEVAKNVPDFDPSGYSLGGESEEEKEEDEGPAGATPPEPEGREDEEPPLEDDEEVVVVAPSSKGKEVEP